MPKAARWSDNDRYFGPFTYAKAAGGFRPLAIVLSSGDGDEHRPSLRLSGFGHTLIVALPPVIRPYREKAQHLSAAEVQRTEQNWSVDRRDFGFSYSEGFLQVFFGRQTNDRGTSRRWSKLLTRTK